MHNSAMLNSFRHHLQGFLHKYGLNNLSLCAHVQVFIRASFVLQSACYRRWCTREEASILSLENQAEGIGWVTRKVVLFVNRL